MGKLDLCLRISFSISFFHVDSCKYPLIYLTDGLLEVLTFIKRLDMKPRLYINCIVSALQMYTI